MCARTDIFKSQDFIPWKMNEDPDQVLCVLVICYSAIAN